MIYTSYFANVKGVLGKKPNMRFCSIAGNTPDWFLEYDKKLDLKSFTCKALMPKWSWWSEWHNKFKDKLESETSKQWYSDKYKETVLNKIDYRLIVKLLYALSGNNDVCLLCYETPNKFCHRHLVRRWLNDNGIECFEI